MTDDAVFNEAIGAVPHRAGCGKGGKGGKVCSCDRDQRIARGMQALYGRAAAAADLPGQAGPTLRVAAIAAFREAVAR